MNKIKEDSWQTRIENFSKIIGLTIKETTDALAEKPFELTCDTEFVLEMLSDETVVPFGDLRHIFCDKKEISIPKLRLGMKFLRGDKESRQKATSAIDPDIYELQSKYGVNIDVKLNDLSPEELIPHYNPKKHNAILKALKLHFSDKKIIAFYPDSQQVAIEETINYISDLQAGFQEEEFVDVNGEPVPLYAIGSIPHQLIDEDPLFQGSPLKRGRSIHNRLNWTYIDVNIRQFARMLVESNKININDRLQMNALFNANTTLSGLKDMFPEVAMLYSRMKKTNNLPSLKVELDNVCEIKTQNPFEMNKSY